MTEGSGGEGLRERGGEAQWGDTDGKDEES